jgi:hypothetical protein
LLFAEFSFILFCIGDVQGKLPLLDDMKITLPNVYSQFASEHAKLLLGNNTNPIYNFHNYGCLVCSLTSVANYFGHAISPIEMNNRLREIGGFPEGSGEYVHGSLSKLFPDITEKVVKINPLQDENLNEIKGALDQGFPVIVGLDYNPRTLQAESHYSILVDYDASNENNFTLADTLGGRVHSLRDYLAFLKPSARKSIFQYFVFSGQVQVKPSPAPEPVPAEVPEASALPANYTEIIHKASQWDDTVKYLELTKPSNQAMFEDAKKVIAGYKSRVTDLDNKKTEAEKKAAEKDVIIDNQKVDIGRLREEVSRIDRLRKAEVDNLKKNVPNFDTLQRQYEGVVKEMQGTIESQSGELKDMRIQVAHKDVELSGAVLTEAGDNQSASASATPVPFVKRPVHLLFTLIRSIVELKV